VPSASISSDSEGNSMTAYDLELALEKNEKYFKELPWQTQVFAVTHLLEQGNSIDDLVKLLNTSRRWINNCIKVQIALEYRPEWLCKHARSLQQAVTTVNLKRAAERRKEMEKLASEATSSPRPIFG
jgi:putative protein kinase ArgK-like GTPase of G3E family